MDRFYDNATFSVSHLVEKLGRRMFLRAEVREQAALPASQYGPNFSLRFY
jgi:hypothetical protein